MAEKRMFTQKIIDSDDFLDMPLSAQALYFHLNMRADDDGFVNKPKSIRRTIGASEDDLKLLLAKRFIIGFESGIIVIKHWRMHNTLRKDRYNPTQYQEEFELLEVKDNGAYTESVHGNQTATIWQPSGNQMEPQYSIDKYRLVESSLVENTNSALPPADAAHDVQKGPSKAEINALFDYLWSLYPVKKGKGQVSDAKRKALYTIGKDELERAIDRYLQELRKDSDWRKPQNGSTFFNAGYVDYLDANFAPDAARPQQQQTRSGYQPPKHGLDRLMEMMNRGDFDE